MDNNQDTVDLSSVEQRSKPFLKPGEYCIRCLSADKKTSKKNNPMIEFTWEIVAPEVVTDKMTGKEVKITGLQLMDWIVLTDVGFPKLKSLHKSAQLSMSISVKATNTKQYLGKAVKVSLKTETSVLKDENTGEPMLDDDTGNPITVNQYRVGRFNGADAEHTMPEDSIAF